MANRMSMYSVASEAGMGSPRGAGQQSTQVSTTTLLNAVHNIYLASQPYKLDAGTSVVVNTWLTATQTGPDGNLGGIIDPALAARAWEHARRRAEDGCIILGYVDALPRLCISKALTRLQLPTHLHPVGSASLHIDSPLRDSLLSLQGPRGG
jgi:chitin synthase